MGWFVELFTIYSTTRVVQIKSKFLAITYFTLVALVWFGILKSYQLDLRKTYQKQCPVLGTFTTKVKGILSTRDRTEEELMITSPDQYQRIWDTQDLILSSEAGFTVMTNIVITANQQRGTCGSNSGSCETDGDCQEGKPDKTFDGIMTGYCLAEGQCQVLAWCPTEEDAIPLNGTFPLLHDTRNFTVLIKTSVEFPDCEPEIVLQKSKPIYRRRNLLRNFTQDYLKTCRYHPATHPYCPIFTIGDIVRWSDEDFDQVGITGGVFMIVVSWSCEFDWGYTIDDCLPQYQFRRVDLPESDDTLAPGFNWRSAVFFEGNRRTLTKHYGVKFIVKVVGEGRKFDFLLLVLTIGASIGLFSFAPLFCDFLFDLFCYFKSFGGPCNSCFSDSFHREIRFQSMEQPNSTTPLPLPPPDEDDLSQIYQAEYSNSLSYDTRL